MSKTDAEWQASLTPEQYHVLREHGTERAGTSPLNAEKRAGTFVCAGCGKPLFSSAAKYESGTGWPSFRRRSTPVDTSTDSSLFMARTEVHCQSWAAISGTSSRRPAPDWTALLHERRRARVRRTEILTHDATHTHPHLTHLAPERCHAFVK